MKANQQSGSKTKGNAASISEEPVYGVFLFNSKGEFISANSKGIDMLGYEEKEMGALNVFDILPAVYNGRQFTELLESQYEYPILLGKQFVCKDGSLILADISAMISSDGIEVVMRVNRLCKG